MQHFKGQRPVKPNLLTSSYLVTFEGMADSYTVDHYKFKLIHLQWGHNDVRT